MRNLCWRALVLLPALAGTVSFGQLTTNLIEVSDVWDFHDSYVFDTGIYAADPPWYATNYATGSGFWGSGQGALWYDPSWVPCEGPGILGHLISFQNQPTLFRRTFLIPDGVGSSAVLRLRYIVDDGLVLYLNGRQVYFDNAPAGPVTANSRARQTREAGCFINATLSVSNLFAGTNWIAAAVLQSSEPQSDVVFGLELDGVFQPALALAVEPPGGFRLSWPAVFEGYMLQSKTNLDATSPWLSVPNQANPFMGSFENGARLFRLAKP